MKRKFFALIFCLLIIVSSLGTVIASAEGGDDTVDAAESLFDGIVAYKLKSTGSESIQAWIDGQLTDKAGMGSEWYALALSQYGTYDFSAYEAGLLKYLDENEIYSASSRLKYALCISAVGGTDGYIRAAMNDSVGKQGIMSLIFGLHLMNNGYSGDGCDRETVIGELIALQCEDGGWSLSGGRGDVDVTAMTVQALTPVYTSDSTVRTAVDGAVSFLSESRLDGGDYMSYGSPNPESTAQVLVAISGLGIDCMSDGRFIKNGNTLIDGIRGYLLPDGSFCHASGGASNETATAQVFYALVSYFRMREGKGPLYILDGADPDAAEPPSTEKLEVPDTDVPSDGGAAEDGMPREEKNGVGYKTVACTVIVGAGIAASAILFVLKKRHFKNFIAVFVVAAVAVCAVCLTNFQSADDYYGTEQKKENVIGTVTVTIRCDTAVGKSDAEYIPADGVILPETELEIESGDTVYVILIEAARKHRIQIDAKGSGSAAYISGINYLYEQELGDLSGWIYRVNGESPSVGCGEYKLSDGDVIEWLYTCDLGNDLK